MRDFICLDIEFPNIDLNKYSNLSDEFNLNISYHCHLYIQRDKIELKVLYDIHMNLENSITNWLHNIDLKKFGTYLKVSIPKNHSDRGILKVDVNEAKCIEYTYNSSFLENGKKYIIISINSIKVYSEPNYDEINTGEFYLNDNGFKVVKPFYSTISFLKPKPNTVSLSISRIRSEKKFYKLGISSFRPEFNFVSSDNRDNRNAVITKEPKIQFKYKRGINEEKAFLYGDIFLKLASFYFHSDIEYIFCKINLPEYTIKIFNVDNKNSNDFAGNLGGMGVYVNFNMFIKSKWQKGTLNNFKILSKAITLFNKSQIVDDYSKFLIRYNIIEICDKQKPKNIKFRPYLSPQQTRIKQNEALKILLETIDLNEHEDFKNRWHNIKTNLQNKPMKNQLVLFLESQNLDPKTFPINISEIKKIRDNITHGSIDNVNYEQLRMINILLYRICGILILNLMGIKDWELNTTLN